MARRAKRTDAASVLKYNHPEKGQFAKRDGQGTPDPLYSRDPNLKEMAVSGVFFGDGTGVAGTSRTGAGIFGRCGPQGLAAIHGVGGQNGVWGESKDRAGSGVWGANFGSGFGVTGYSANSWAIYASTAKPDSNNQSPNRKALLADGDVQVNDRLFVDQKATIKGDCEVWGQHRVKGDVKVLGDLLLVSDESTIIQNNGDCAEDFDVDPAMQLDPGTVVVISSDGLLQACNREYDKRVAGVISGAGSYRPAMILNRSQSRRDRVPVAILGKVFCRVDAAYGVVQTGDLLTTSPTLGHAMKASDHRRAFGTVIGKALQPLTAGIGLVAMLVALQ